MSDARRGELVSLQPYRVPSVRVMGDVEQLTAGLSGGSEDDLVGAGCWETRPVSDHEAREGSE
jgi:hypothetical protein